MRHCKLFAVFLGFSGIALLAMGAHLAAATAHRLAGDKSPFLRSAANQPVDWYRLGPEAIRAAKQRKVPILLEMGASWCSNCLAMDRESFSDKELAQYINDHFVAVRVDHDEDTGFTNKLQQAQSDAKLPLGLPLLMVVAPDGSLFDGGSYFPPKPAKYKPSFSEFVHQAFEEFAHKNFRIALRDVTALIGMSK